MTAQAEHTEKHFDAAVEVDKTPPSFRAYVSRIIPYIKPSAIKYKSWRTKAGIFLVFAAILSGIVTYAALTETPPFGDDPDLVIWLLNIDLVILLLLVTLIARRIVTIWSGRRRGIAGSHLHVRLVYTFSILVAVPTVMMAVFSAFFFHFGVQAWFSARVQTAINESQAVAQSYLAEHKQVIRADVLNMANDLDRQADLFLINERALNKAVEAQSFLRNLSEVILITEDGRVIFQSALAFTLAYEKPSAFEFQRAKEGDVVFTTNEDQDRVRALVKLNNMPGVFLFVGRMIDPQVSSHLSAVQVAAEDYKALQARFSGIQITVTMIFVVVALLLLLAAIWSGLLLARQLVRPIGELINAADRVRAGDLSSRLPEAKRLEEFDYLAQSFNRMTTQIQSQRNDLIDANRELDRRRKLTETVLAGVSSGVIGVNHDGTINLANNSALDLLSRGSEGDDLTGRYILDALPELEGLLDNLRQRPKRVAQGEIPISIKGKGKRVLFFRASVEVLEDDESGLIITFDDITDLQSAQRKAAWSDVARRIAHEIKNPLTPIQLSAERLKRKYADEVSNSDTFDQCTDTIIKHVEDIGRMVDEFSSFARMPEPILKPENLGEIVRDSITLSRQAHEDITFSFAQADNRADYNVQCDVRQIRQVMTNLLKNAVDSIQETNKQGIVDVLVGTRGEGDFFVSVTDNGQGFPEEQNLSTLTDPYITHKQNGTGLGLAIVKKIIEDHHGALVMGAPPWISEYDDWKNYGGACVVATIPGTKSAMAA